MNTISGNDTKINNKMAFTRYSSKENSLTRASFDGMNLYSTRDSNKKFHPLRNSEQFTGSYDLLKTESPNLPEILIPSNIDNVLKKTNQRLLRNIDPGKLKKAIEKNKESMNMIKNKKINTKAIKQYQDYNIRENCNPVKKNYMTIPQKPSKVYDWINNVDKIIQPPNIQLENYSNYRDNYYKAINKNDKAFSKHLGYFSYFNEKTRREREMNTLYSRKNLTKFADKMRDNSEERREKWARLKDNFFTPSKKNLRYADQKMGDTNKSLKKSLSKKRSETDQMYNRRASGY
jgi:DNA-binding PucR family transcriptional regulator